MRKAGEDEGKEVRETPGTGKGRQKPTWCASGSRWHMAEQSREGGRGEQKCPVPAWCPASLVSDKPVMGTVGILGFQWAEKVWDSYWSRSYLEGPL